MEDLLMYHPTITKMLSDERIREYTARAAPRRPPAAPCAALPLDARAIHVAHRIEPRVHSVGGRSGVLPRL